MRSRRPLKLLPPALAAVTVGSLVLGCSALPGDDSAEETTEADRCEPVTPTQALPAERAVFGLNPDWAVESLQDFADITGVSPGAAVTFIDMPFNSEDSTNVLAAADQVAGMGGVLMLTLEPHEGLGAVNDESVAALTELLSEVNAKGVPVLLRFAHEMNGSWYPWGQQPEAYVEAFRTVATAVREDTPGTEMIWAPNYGGGYPFSGGEFEAEPGASDFALLDTDGDGELTETDDPYAPYYPGDDVVDWVGMSLYHWGSTYPWESSEMPEDDKFSDQLHGTYDGLAGDESILPDFYSIYSEDRDKPLAIPETAAFVTADASPELALDIKRAWWRQIFSPEMHSEFPNLRMVNWFNWDKYEPEVDATVRWSVSTDQQIADAFREDLPEWMAQADDVASCPAPD